MKFKYQYTYYIYPFIIEKSNYEKYLLKTIKEKKFKIRLFEKEKDLEIYSYFAPSIRTYMFQSFELSKKESNDLLGLKDELKAKILKKMPCAFFEYDVEEQMQGKIIDDCRHIL